VMASPALQVPPVNPAQAPTTQNSVDVSAMIAQYENRIRTLMSDKDKAINERNQAITAQAQMQQSLTEYQSQASTTLASTTTAAQQAIDENKRLGARVNALEAELQRANVVLAKPELAPYIQFIPAESDPAKLQAAVEQLEQIRMNDMARSGVRTFPGQPSALQTTTTPTQQDTNLYALYGQRPTMAPAFQAPASSPAMMNPAGAGDVLQNIDTMLKEAMASGDPVAFETAVKSAQLLATQDINRQLGRT
jgi:DNA repair exonuclease SbcCD ATPase subunit